MVIFLSITLAACGSGSSGPKYFIGGSVSGLFQGNVVQIQVNGTDTRTIPADGPFTFSNQLETGSTYLVAISSQPNGQSCSVGNGTGVVGLTNISSVTVTCSGLTYTVGGSVSGLAVNESFVMEVNSVDQLIIENNGTFHFKDPLPTGSSYSVAVLRQPTGETCSLINAKGIVTSDDAAVSRILVVCKFKAVSGSRPHFAFVENSGDHTESVYSIDANTGALVPITGSPFLLGGPPTFDPSGKFIYTVNRNASSIWAYLIDPTTGVPAAVTGSPFPTGLAPVTAVVDPSGRFVYVANSGDGTVSVYAIDAQTGALRPIEGSPFALGGNPSIDPSGRFAYVINASTGMARVFSVNATTGALTATGTSTLGTGAPPYVSDSTNVLSIGNMMFDPFGRFAYLPVEILVGRVWHYGVLGAFAINSIDGALTPVTGFPVNSSSYTSAALTFDPVLDFAYVGGVDSLAFPYLAAYQLDAVTGALLPDSGTSVTLPLANQPFPAHIQFEPTGRFAYVATDHLSAYAVDRTSGKLTPISGSPFATDVHANSLAIDADGKRLFLPNWLNSTISVFDIESTTGVLTPVKGNPFATGINPASIMIR